MFEINVPNLFFLYLMTWMLFLVVLWARELWRLKAYSWALSEGSLCICEKCHYAFMVKPGENVARCGRCNEICVIRKKKRWI